jgi:hypothetical protein
MGPEQEDFTNRMCTVRFTEGHPIAADAYEFF